jgi:hypothetical protein
VGKQRHHGKSFVLLVLDVLEQELTLGMTLMTLHSGRTENTGLRSLCCHGSSSLTFI